MITKVPSLRSYLSFVISFIVLEFITSSNRLIFSFSLIIAFLFKYWGLWYVFNFTRWKRFSRTIFFSMISMFYYLTIWYRFWILLIYPLMFYTLSSIPLVQPLLWVLWVLFCLILFLSLSYNAKYLLIFYLR